MTFGEMAGYTKRFNQIMEIKESKLKYERLGSLLSDLRERYDIRMYGNRLVNPYAMELYNTVFEARWS